MQLKLQESEFARCRAEGELNNIRLASVNVFVEILMKSQFKTCIPNLEIHFLTMHNNIILQKAESAMKKVEIAERAQREASNVEKDYEEVVQLLEAEVVKLKEDRKIVSTVN